METLITPERNVNSKLQFRDLSRAEDSPIGHDGQAGPQRLPRRQALSDSSGLGGHAVCSDPDVAEARRRGEGWWGSTGGSVEL